MDLAGAFHVLDNGPHFAQRVEVCCLFRLTVRYLDPTAVAIGVSP